MPTTARIHQHRKPKSGKALKFILLALAVAAVLAIIVGLLVLMNNPTYQNRP